MAISTHQGGCHCGAVRYAVDLDPTIEALTCNCSLCGRTGSYLQFVAPTAFRVLAGEDQLTDYQFNRKVIHHLFCKTCGVRPFARGAKPDGTPMVAINVRTLDDIDAHRIPTRQYDGKSA